MTAADDMLPVLKVAALEQSDPEARWLVRDLWGHQAVGVLGGAPKLGKSWLGLDFAVSVASGTPCIGRFEVDHPGPSLVYLAEDALGRVRERVAALCEHRRLDLEALDVHVVTAPSLRLDRQLDRDRLDATLARLRPRLLVLDPLVRLHRLDENSSSDISGLLGYLRELNRRHDLAVILVHHMSKKARADLGQALRGSGDLHAWVDSACYLVRRKRGIELIAEHRAAPAPDPIILRLVDTGPPRLEVQGPSTAPPPLAHAARSALLAAGEPRTRAALRSELRVNNKRLGDALLALQSNGLAHRTKAGWIASTPPPDDQLDLLP